MHTQRTLARLGRPVDDRGDGAWNTALRQAPRFLGALLLAPLRRRRSFTDEPVAREEFWGLLRLGYLQYYLGAWSGMAATSWRLATLVARYPAPSRERARVDVELAALLVLGGWLRPPTGWLIERSARYAQETGDQLGIHVAHLTWGMYHAMRGNLQEGLKELDTGLEFIARQRQGFEWSATFIFVLLILFNLGELSRCEMHARQVVATGEEMSSPVLTSWGRFLLALVSERRGDTSNAIELLARAQTDFEAAGDHTGRFATRGMLARCWLRRGDYGRAIGDAQMILADRSRQRVDVWSLLFPQGALTDALIAARRAGSLPGKEGLDRLKRAVRAWLAMTKRMPLGEPEALLARAVYEALTDKPKSARKTLERALARAEETGQTYAAAHVRMALARFTRDADLAARHLRQALTTFDGLGAAKDAEAVRELMASTTVGRPP